MLIFELKCQSGHIFEGWYNNLEDLEQQLADQLVDCPICGHKKVYRMMSSFAIGGKKSPVSNPEDETRRSTQALKQAMHRFLAENFEDVGSDFFKEALKMHYGSLPLRNIRGISSPQEEEVLRDEGVNFFKLDARIAPPDSEEPEHTPPHKNKNKPAN
ncbi:MAG: DUF1178 family protein [Desulfarculales bacterium]|nr:DUF1178 family protein [Desulfarculales bacterium]